MGMYLKFFAQLQRIRVMLQHQAVKLKSKNTRTSWFGIWRRLLPQCHHADLSAISWPWCSLNSQSVTSIFCRVPETVCGPCSKDKMVANSHYSRRLKMLTRESFGVSTLRMMIFYSLQHRERSNQVLNCGMVLTATVLSAILSCRPTKHKQRQQLDSSPRKSSRLMLSLWARKQES